MAIWAFLSQTTTGLVRGAPSDAYATDEPKQIGDTATIPAMATLTAFRHKPAVNFALLE
jgi:hypothetical protein